MEGVTPQRTRLRLGASGGKEPGVFSILAITAGSGNGWIFGEEALRRSLPLWDGVECFVDHAAGVGGGRSLRDLGGVCLNPVWDAAAGGIRLELHTAGPSAALVEHTGREMTCTAGLPRPRVGFSADVGFSARGRQVTEILKVYSVDLVVSPARGGAFVRALNAANGVEILKGASMEEPKEERMTETMADKKEETMAASACTRPQPAPADAGDGTNPLLEAGLQASRLPLPMQERLRRRFEHGRFEPVQFQGAVQEYRELLGEMTGAAVVQGPGRISGVYDSRDQLQAAVDDLFGAARQQSLAGCQPARLSGIRELYLTLTGDYDLHGGYHPGRARLSTTADFTGLVKNAMNKLVASRWEEMGRAGYDWWNRVVTVEHFNSLQQITGTLVGTVGSLPAVAEGAEYGELAIGDSPEVASFTKYGGYIPLTLELIDRDETRKLKAYPQELASAGLRKVSSLVAAVFTENSGVGPAMADGGNLFNATAVTSAGGHKNLLTTALSASEWDVVGAAVYNQPMLVKNAAGAYGTGARMAINPRYLLAPRALQLTAMKVLYPTLENAASIYSENQQRGQPGDVVTVPDWSDPSDWAAVCDPRVAPAIFVGERFGIMPEVFIAGDELSPAVFTNDEHRLKVRHFLAVWVNDFRPLHKSNV